MLKESIEESIKKNLEIGSSKTLTQLSYKIINEDDSRLNSKVLYEILINQQERDKILKINILTLELKSLANEFVIRPGSSTIRDIISATIRSAKVSNDVTKESDEKSVEENTKKDSSN